MLTIVTWLVDLLIQDLRLPDILRQLALSSHMGQPMVGACVVACLVLAIGGLALGAAGIARRDITR